MRSLYTPPNAELGEPPQQPPASATPFARVCAVLLLVFALFSLFSVTTALISGLEDSFETFERHFVFGLLVLFSCGVNWGISAVILWRGQRRAWLWVLAPFATFVALTVIEGILLALSGDV